MGTNECKNYVMVIFAICFATSLAMAAPSITTNKTTMPVNSAPHTMGRQINSNSFLRGLTVHYEDKHVNYNDFVQLHGHEFDRNNNFNDINKGFGGKFVYLKPEWTTNGQDAVDNVQIIIQGSSLPGFDDLAKGAGGDFRYALTQNRGATEKISEIVLWEGELFSTPVGWNARTIDINRGRGGRFLYLVWRTRSI